MILKSIIAGLAIYSNNPNSNSCTLIMRHTREEPLCTHLGIYKDNAWNIRPFKFSLSRMNPCDVHQVIKLLDKLSRSFDNNCSARFKFYIYFLHQVITILVPFFFFSSIHLGTPRRNIKLQSAYPNPPSACYIYSVEPKIKMKPFIF